MFFVFNRSKINSYLISVGTVAMLLVIGAMMNNNPQNTIPTGANEYINSNVLTNEIKNKMEINEYNSVI